MRFVWAVAALILAALLIVAGISQRTVFAGPPTQSAQLTASDDVSYLLVDGAAMSLQPGSQTLEVSGSHGVFVAYGRTPDLTAWLGDQQYDRAAVDAEGAISVTTVEPTEPAAAAPHNPVGSDLWLGEYTADDSLTETLQIPDGMSLLITSSDGTGPVPDQVTITWPRTTATPWAGPLIALGVLVLLLGIVLYVLAIRHLRRSRGPRRKGPPPLPETQPIDLAIEEGEKGVISSGQRPQGRRAFVAIPLLLAAPLVFAGCSAEAWPQLSASPAPSGTGTAVAAPGQRPAVTDVQAEQILNRVAETVAQADANRDETLAATRIDGPVLEARKVNYTLRGQASDYPAPPVIPSESVHIILPQAYDEWPRTVMLVADQDTTSAVLLLTQQDPWSNYKLVYQGDLGASTQLPDLAPWYIGAPQVPPASTFLTLAPDALAAAYSDVLTNGSNSSSYALFDEDDDAFSRGVAADRQDRLNKFTASGPAATLTFSSTPGTSSPLALATLESGAIVAVTVRESDIVTPTDSQAVIKLDNNVAVRALTGVSESSTTVTTTFEDQLFFYVPAQGSTEKIRVLGSSSNIIEAKVDK